MTKENVIDFISYTKRPGESLHQHPLMSEELKTAIEDLIDQMRKSGPLYQAG